MKLAFPKRILLLASLSGLLVSSSILMGGGFGCNGGPSETSTAPAGGNPLTEELATALATEAASDLTTIATKTVEEEIGFSQDAPPALALAVACPSGTLAFPVCDNVEGKVTVTFESCSPPAHVGSMFNVLVTIDIFHCERGSQTLDGSFPATLEIGPISVDQLLAGSCDNLAVDLIVTMTSPIFITTEDGVFEFSMSGIFANSSSCDSEEGNGAFKTLKATVKGGGDVATCRVIEGRIQCILDRDEDGVANAVDNCPDIFNPSQSNSDGEGSGDLCQTPPARPFCGDGVCQEGEDGSNCDRDCHCGNGICDKEDLDSPDGCPTDCFCGDGYCAPNEDAVSCPTDCFCGNGYCEPDEDADNCFKDCHCGNGICEADITFENFATCSQDCHCGNGACQPELGETIENCKLDCSCYPTAGCGDGICCKDEGGGKPGKDGGGASCPADCPAEGPICGDGFCQPGETHIGCPIDCYCGNTTCDDDESHTIGDPNYCPGDCHCGDGVVEPDAGAFEECEPGVEPDPCLEKGLVCAGEGKACTCISCGNGVCDVDLNENQPCIGGVCYAGSCPQDCVGVGYCGDGVCDSGSPLFEDASNCVDCACGDGICESDVPPYEYSGNCPQDCPPVCGNYSCEYPYEADIGGPYSCPFDCNCGYGTCDPQFGETPANCRDCSCGVDGDGDGNLCDQNWPLFEDNCGCPSDCPAVIGDGRCDCYEDPALSFDCSCGNGVCEPNPPLNETEANCRDCSCGNGICDSNPPLSEDTCSCHTDCPNTCGNGICECGDFEDGCPDDCGPPPPTP
jgi:hypothetical protein